MRVLDSCIVLYCKLERSVAGTSSSLLQAISFSSGVLLSRCRLTNISLISLLSIKVSMIEEEDKVTINIQGGRPGIELQEAFSKLKIKIEEVVLIY